MATLALTLWRAADDDIITDCASFATSREAAEEYLNNPGFGGRSLYTTTVQIDESSVLDLYGMGAADAIQAIRDITGLPHPGAIGPDEWAPRISYELREAGIEWVRVRESFPADTETWIFVGSDEIELDEIGAAGIPTA